MQYTVVFDVTESGYRHGWFASAGVGLALLAPIVLYPSMRLYEKRIPRWVYLVCMLPPLAWSLVVFTLTWWDYARLSSALTKDRCEVVEGIVEDSRRAPATGHAMEWFVVNGKRFEYASDVASPGFNTEQEYGGPIRKGVQVRIHHLGNDIARLEIAQ